MVLASTASMILLSTTLRVLEVLHLKLVPKHSSDGGTSRSLLRLVATSTYTPASLAKYFLAILLQRRTLGHPTGN